jgi:Lipocalin-like domain
MHRLLFALTWSLASWSCVAQPSLEGTYRLASLTVEYDGQPPLEIMGKSPRGYLILTRNRLMNIISAQDRKFGASSAEKAALWDSLIAFTGRYRVEGSKLVVSVDVSWNERWNGTQVTRNWQLDGNRLLLTTARAPSPFDQSRMVVARLTFERETP